MERRAGVILNATLALALFVPTMIKAQPVVIADVPNTSSGFVQIGDLVYFTADDALWRTNGTPSGTMQLKTGFGTQYNLTIGWRNRERAQHLNGDAYLVSDDATKLWRSDGTPSGTLLLKTSVSNIRIVGATEDYLLFVATDPATGEEIYRTDGTISGTILIEDVNPGHESGYKGASAVVNNELFFAGNNGINGTELWKTNGTAAGTVMVKDVNPGPADGLASGTGGYSFNNLFFFRGNTPGAGMEPWVSDGTLTGTSILKDLKPGAQSSLAVKYAIANNDELYFLIFDDYGSDVPGELWKTRGTPGSTTFIKTIGDEFNGHDYHSFLAFRGKIYFWDRMNHFSDNLWVTDGTDAGTHTIFHGSADGMISFFEVVNDYMLFTGSTQDAPWNLYRSDGTSGGTTVFAEFAARAPGTYPRDLTSVANYLFYGDHDGITEPMSGQSCAEEDYYHLHQSDGNTSESMRSLWAINTIGTDNITGLNGKVVFTTHDTQSGSMAPQKKLWVYDPSAAVESTAKFTLMNADTERDIKRLLDGALISNPENIPLNIRYDAIGVPGSVVFTLNGTEVRTETAPPYSLAGDVDSDFAPWHEAAAGTYTLTATPYSEADGRGTPGRALTVTFTIKCTRAADDCFQTGEILRETWAGVEGNSVSGIPIERPADNTASLGRFEGPASTTTNYGARIRGYVHPPATGQYTFWIASDDESELWLSSDENPTNKIRIAFVSGATDPRQWDKNGSQRSVAITLAAGQRYYIEALHKQGDGTDHVAVGWQLPDGTLERPVPGRRLSPFRMGTGYAPAVEITSPATGQTFSATADILIEASASDGDEQTIAKVQFYAGPPGAPGTKIGEDLTEPYAFLWEDAAAGNYDLYAFATDADGNITGSAPVKITVNQTSGDPIYSAINIYPNPARSNAAELTIAGYEAFAGRIETDITIVNMTGEIIFSGRISCGGDCSDYPLNLNQHLPAGLYMVRMKSNGVQYSRRLLVK